MAGRTSNRPRAQATKVVEPDTFERQSQSAIDRLNAAEINAGRPPAHDKSAAKAAAKAKLDRAQRAERARQAGNQRANGRPPKPARAEVHQQPDEEPFDIDKSIRDMSREHIECRDLRHSWRPWSARWNAKGNYYEDILQCGRCQTERIRRINTRGQLLDSHYEYADGYVMKGSGRMTQDMNSSLRLASLRTRLVKDTVEE